MRKGRLHVSPDKDGLCRVDTNDMRNLWAGSTLDLTYEAVKKGHLQADRIYHDPLRLKKGNFLTQNGWAV